MISKNKLSVGAIVKCQKILSLRKCSRAEIADNFTPGSLQSSRKFYTTQQEYNAWYISRHIKPISNSEKKNPSYKKFII